MKKFIILLPLILSTAQKAIGTDDFEIIESFMKEAGKDYAYNHDLSMELTKFKKDLKLAKTMAFTTNSKYREHIVSIDLQADNDKLNLRIYDAKSITVEKKLTYEPSILAMQAPVIRELIHRMTERPQTSINFKMMEEIMQEILPKFQKLTYKPEFSEDGVKLKFTAQESTVALFDIRLTKQDSGYGPHRFDYSLNGNYEISIRNNKLDSTNFKVDMFKGETLAPLAKKINETGNIDKYFNNLCTVAKVYTEAMTELGFKDIVKIQRDEPGQDSNQILVKMKLYKSTVLSELNYHPEQGFLGTYSLKTYKILSDANQELKLDKNILSELKFTRHLLVDLKELFKGNNIADKLNLYHMDLYEKFKEIYNNTFGVTYPEYTLSEPNPKIENGETSFFMKKNNDRKVNMLVTSKNAAGSKLCTFTYREYKGEMILEFESLYGKDPSKLSFLIDDFDFDIAANYIFMIVTTSYNFGQSVPSKEM